MTTTDVVLRGVLTVTALNALIRSANAKKKRLKKKKKKKKRGKK